MYRLAGHLFQMKQFKSQAFARRSTRLVLQTISTNTDADHVNEEEVTLQEIIFKETMNDQKSVILMKQMENEGPTYFKNKKIDLPGVKQETKDKVIIKFK